MLLCLNVNYGTLWVACSVWSFWLASIKALIAYFLTPCMESWIWHCLSEYFVQDDSEMKFSARLLNSLLLWRFWQVLSYNLGREWVIRTCHETFCWNDSQRKRWEVYCFGECKALPLLSNHVDSVDWGKQLFCDQGLHLTFGGDKGLQSG